MDVNIKIVSSDYELVFDLVGSRRFPERKDVVCPGEAIMSSQSLKPVTDKDYSDDIIEFVISFSETSNVAEFAKWFFHTLAEREEAIISLEIAGNKIELDEESIVAAISSASN
jgi:hypothetical protein